MGGTNVGSVFFDVGMNNTAFRRGIQSNASYAEGVLGKAFKSLGKMAIAAFSVKAITDFATSSINLASDLEEVQNVIDVTFGAGNSKIEEFAQTSMKAYGLSELSAKQYMGTMGAMLKSMGLSSSAVETMSMDITALAGDMASFYNLDTDDAFAKLRGGISGETEPLKQLGINMSVASMEAFALSQGISKSYNSMSQAEQALLRYNYLMSVTSDAQGDFTRTSGGWANQVRVLKLQWDSFKASLGGVFIVALTPVIQGLNWLMGKLVAAANTFKSFINLITGGKAQIESTGGGGVAQAAESVAAVGDAAEGAGKKAAKGAKQAKGALASFDELNNLNTSSDSGSGSDDGGSGGGGTDLGSVDTSETHPALEETGNKLDILKEKVKGFLDAWGLTTPFYSFVNTCKTELGAIASKATESWNTISSTAGLAFGRIVEAVKPLVTPIGTLGFQVGELFVTYISQGIQATMGILSTAMSEAMNVMASGVELASAIAQPVLGSLVTFLSENGEQIKTRMSEVWHTIEFTVSDVITSISNTIQTIYGGFTEWFQVHGGEIQNALEGTWNAVWAGIDAIWTGIEAVCVGVFGGISKFLNENMGSIRDTLVNTWDIIWQIIEPIWNTISDICTEIFGGIKDFFSDNMGTIKEIVAGAFEYVWLIIKNALDKIKAFWDTWGGTIMAAVQGVLNNIKNIFSFVWETIKNSLQTVLDVIKGIIQTALAIVKGDWSGAWEGIKGIFTSVWNGMKTQMGNIANFLKNTFTNAKDTLKNVWNQIMGVFKAPINTIIGWINKLINAWNALSFEVPEVDVPLIGKVGGFTVGVPKIKNIPQLAKGGLVDRPTLSVIGEAGKEAVVPLENNTGWMVNLANILADAIVAKLAMAQGSDSNQQTTLKLMLDGREMGEVLLDYLISAAERRGLKLALGR